MTAYRALYTVGELRANDQVAIMGAGGGLSTAAVQLAHVRGARVVVVTSDEAKGARARELGADEVVLRPRGSPGDRELWEASGKRGFDVIFDSTGEATFAGAVRPVVDAVLPLEGGPEALTRLARGEVFGKLVLRPS
jgi:NADPH:quinone reductase-like Zn-dependent oxidoreductase